MGPEHVGYRLPPRRRRPAVNASPVAPGGVARAAAEAEVAGALERLGLDARDASGVEALAGTGNRSVRLRHGGRDLVLRIDGEETAGLVDRERERRHAMKAAALGVAPALAAVDAAAGVTLFHYVEGRRFDRLPRPYGAGALARLGGAFARLRGAEGFSGRMDPWAKIDAYLAEAGVPAPDAEAGFGPQWPAIRGLRRACRLDRERLAASHVDPVPENVLDCGDRVVLLDWEYSALCHPLWDIAYFAAEAALSPAERRALLAAAGMEDDMKTLARWIAAAQAVSLAWCLVRVRRAAEPSFWRREVARRRSALARALAAAE